MSVQRSQADLAALLADIEAQLFVPPDTDAVLATLTRLAVERVEGAQYAGVTHGRDGRFSTVARTDELVEHVDQIQYRLESGPCVDAVVEQGVFCSADLRSDTRWPRMGRLTYESTGVVSMLSFRLFMEKDPDVVAGLNMYSKLPDAFEEEDEITGMVLATAGALAVSGALARAKADNLQVALVNSREIGIAIGVLMNQHKLTREQGFDLLRMASQGTQRKLADIAREVGDTGALPPIRARRNQGT